MRSEPQSTCTYMPKNSFRFQTSGHEKQTVSPEELPQISTAPSALALPSWNGRVDARHVRRISPPKVDGNPGPDQQYLRDVQLGGSDDGAHTGRGVFPEHWDLHRERGRGRDQCDLRKRSQSGGGGDDGGRRK